MFPIFIRCSLPTPPDAPGTPGKASGDRGCRDAEKNYSTPLRPLGSVLRLTGPTGPTGPIERRRASGGTLRGSCHGCHGSRTRPNAGTIVGIIPGLDRGCMYTWGWLTAGQEASHPLWGIDGEAVHEKETFFVQGTGSESRRSNGEAVEVEEEAPLRSRRLEDSDAVGCRHQQSDCHDAVPWQ